ncbi:hypothetical protein ACWDTP_38300 [Mycobacterium sp. NPDC003449]
MSAPIPEPAADLLRAVLDALDIPYPATVGDAERRDKILADRAMHTVIALRDVLDHQPHTNVEWSTAYLRRKVAQHPPTGYRAVGVPLQDGGRP